LLPNDSVIECKDEDKKRGMYRYERKYSGFYRFIALPDGVDTDSIKASYKNGVLEVRVPKTEEKKKSRKVKVE
jgi:HSP20 family protein